MERCPFHLKVWSDLTLNFEFRSNLNIWFWNVLSKLLRWESLRWAQVNSGGNHSALGPGLHPARVDGLFGCAPPNSSTPASFTFYPFIQRWDWQSVCFWWLMVMDWSWERRLSTYFLWDLEIAPRYKGRRRLLAVSLDRGTLFIFCHLFLCVLKQTLNVQVHKARPIRTRC